jgi:hypothetical protein
LSLEEQPLANSDAGRLERDGVYVLTVGTRDGTDAAVASAMIAVEDAGAVVLWKTGV